MKKKTSKTKKYSRSAFIETALLTLLLISTYYSNSGRQKAILQQGSNSIQSSPFQQNQDTSQKL